MFFVTGIVFGDFVPEVFAVIEVAGVAEFVNEDVILERFGDFHKGNIERNNFFGGAGAPAGSAKAEFTKGVGKTVFLGEKGEAVWEVVGGLFFEDFHFCGVGARLKGLRARCSTPWRSRLFYNETKHSRVWKGGF